MRFNNRNTTRLTASGAVQQLSGGPFVDYPKFVEESASVTVTADTSAHTKGAWAELIASAASDSSVLFLQITGISATTVNTASLLDVGIGAAGFETVIVANVGAGGASAASYMLPVKIPKRTRVSARLQSLVTGGKTGSVSAVLCTTVLPWSPSTLDTYGATTATSSGTNMPTSNTYVELTAATTRAYQGVVVSPTLNGGAVAAETVTYTVGVGAVGVESTHGATRIVEGSTEFILQLNGAPTYLPGHIPSGARLACKQSTGRNYRDVILIGVPYG